MMQAVQGKLWMPVTHFKTLPQIVIGGQSLYKVKQSALLNPGKSMGCSATIH
jgi:hypothetical protein